MSFYRLLLRPVLFQLPAESAHRAALALSRLMGSVPGATALMRGRYQVQDPCLGVKLAGLTFSNPVGLAAGWDKQATALRLLEAMGFGFAEIGSISARPSAGNPGPRLFRLPQDNAIVVNYGLPNPGAEIVAQRLKRFRRTQPLGVNVVKTNDGPTAPPCSDAAVIEDYLTTIKHVHDRCDYLMLNLSCPNTGHEQAFFARPGNLSTLLQQFDNLGIQTPVFLKIAPTDDGDQIEQLLLQCEPSQSVAGFSVNLPTGKPAELKLQTEPSKLANMPGAIAGQPVKEKLNRCLRRLYQQMDRDRYRIIGSGGVFTAEDAYEKICYGASLVQLYTALVYHGPSVVKQINRGLAQLLSRDGYDHVSQAVGSRA